MFLRLVEGKLQMVLVQNLFWRMFVATARCHYLYPLKKSFLQSLYTNTKMYAYGYMRKSKSEAPQLY